MGEIIEVTYMLGTDNRFTASAMGVSVGGLRDRSTAERGIRAVLALMISPDRLRDACFVDAATQLPLVK